VARIEVSVQDLDALSQAYRQAAAGIDAHLAQLTSQASPLRDSWIGSASSSFQAAASEVESTGRGLCLALEQMATLLASASQAYSSEESSVSSAFRP